MGHTKLGSRNFAGPHLQWKCRNCKVTSSQIITEARLYKDRNISMCHFFNSSRFSAVSSVTSSHVSIGGGDMGKAAVIGCLFLMDLATPSSLRLWESACGKWGKWLKVGQELSKIASHINQINWESRACDWRCVHLCAWPVHVYSCVCCLCCQFVTGHAVVQFLFKIQVSTVI